MTFDKTKAMRNAEKYLAQGKLRSAIGEYEQVVKYDSKDFGTINMLGDLYSKNTDPQSAIRCYTAVAEHYAKQGFAQKAIAVYNKISRLDPNSVEVWQNLAELYKQKGSIAESRNYYKKVAEHFEKTGRKLDALAMWREIALLDVTNTEAYLSLADSYLAEGQMDEAREAYAEVGRRFARRSQHEQAAAAFDKALAINKSDTRVLADKTASMFALGRPKEMAESLAEALAVFPHSREIRFLLIDCLIEVGEIADAEQAVIKLVELEPANYPKFLDLAKIYLENGDMASATRILTMSSEHMLMGGQAEEFSSLVNSILIQNPDQLDALRLQARFCSWQRDDEALTRSLDRLAKVAKHAGSVEDERFALLQLTMLVPHDMNYANRLREINVEHGFESAESEENLFDKRFLKNNGTPAAEEPVQFVDAEEGSANFDYQIETFESETTDFAFTGEVTEVADDFGSGLPEMDLAAAADLHRLQKEIEGIRFYIDNGYLELAEKAANELRGEFGERAEIEALIAEVQALTGGVGEEEYADLSSSLPQVHDVSLPPVEPPALARSVGINDLRTELGLDEIAAADDTDYETSFNTAIAYKEMGLVEQGIKEFQQAASVVRPNDGTRRFFACANMLGLCFMEQAMPHLAVKWFERALETSDLTTDEKQGIWYELAAAYEAKGESETAGRFFEQVYAENANFRDVSDRIKALTVGQH